VAESKNILSDFIPKIATGLCAGISRTCGTCGAVIGAVMALNLFYGRSNPNESLETNFAVVQKLLDIFISKFGSTNCQQLIGCDLGTEEGQNTFKENKLVERCKDYTEEATKMAMSIIEDLKQKR
jgi:C_GCAxxG_C_C family probable redox protein